MAQDEAIAELTREREPPRSVTPAEMSDSGDGTRIEPVETASESDMSDSGESKKDPPATGSPSSSTSDIDGRGDNVDIVA